MPDEVVERLEALAESRGMSVSAFALSELTEASRRAANPRLLAELPDQGVPTSTIVEGLDAERAAR